jgi:hypothetical protein
MKYFLYLFVSILFFYSCAEKNTNIARKVIAKPKVGQEKIAFPDRNEILFKDHLKSLNTVPEIFLISNDNDTTITGKNGTNISIHANCILSDRKKATGLIQIELIELTKKTDFIFNNRPTVSNKKMLITGGSIYMNAKQGSHNLTIGCPSGITVSMPHASTEPGMELFLGESNKNGITNWVKDSSLSPLDMNGVYNYEGAVLTEEESEIAITSGDVIVVEDKMRNYIFSTRKFGWINCDAFYEYPNEKVDIIVTIPNSYPEDYTVRVYAVFKSLNSIMQLYSNDNEKFTMSGLPEGEEVYLISLAARDNLIHMDVRTSLIKKDNPIAVTLKETTKEAIKKELEMIN